MTNVLNKNSDFEKAHEKYHRKQSHKKKLSELDKFHDHYGPGGFHEDDGHNMDSHKFHTGHKFALVGNPNCGKTTLFNYLTGSSQYVGNWPGVTVEKKEGRSKMGGENLTIVDLPGIYSMSPYTAEEIVSRNYIIDEKPDLIINIVDATNLERNLYLTSQLLELGRPVIVALNMVDMLKSRGDEIDVKLLQERLGVRVVPITASKGDGVMELMHRAHKYAEEKRLPKTINFYSGDAGTIIETIEDLIKQKCIERQYPLRWAAVNLFQGDSITKRDLDLNTAVMAKIEELRSVIPVSDSVDHDIIVADSRYKWSCDICSAAVKRGQDPLAPTFSDKIDGIVTNKFTAIPFFALVMFLTFYLTFGSFGSWLSDMSGVLIDDMLIPAAANLLNKAGASEWAVSLVCDGALAGVGAVLAFLPQITVLFFFLSILEDSGYMSRAAFIMDKLLRKVGLSGKSFVPMLMGFGCTVPAVMCTRTIENEKDKRATILITPFMSCSAKMPVYAMIIAAFFPRSGGVVILGIYLLGIAVAALMALVFNKTLLKGEAASFVMELPPYRLPTLRGLWLHIWERLKDYISKAGSVILGATIVVWFLRNFTFGLEMTNDSSRSILAGLGMIIAPIFAPCGFGTWESAVSLLTGVIAKEQVVSTMTVLYGQNISSALPQIMSPLAAVSFLVFTLLYTPCVAAVTTIRREMNSKKWTLFSVVFQLLLAWFVSMLIFQIGSLFI